MSDPAFQPAIRLLAIIEASTVTGPVKNLLSFFRTARALPGATGLDLSLATFRRGDAARGSDAFFEAAAAAGIPVDCVRERTPLDWQQIRQLRRIVEERAPDIIQSHAVKSHFLVRLSGLWKERPWVAFHHGYTAPNLKMRVYNQFDRWSLRAPRLIITVSEAFRRDLAALGAPADRIRVVHNAIDQDFMGALQRVNKANFRASLGIDAEEKVVLAVGRLSREKAIPDLVRAVELLNRSEPGMKTRLLVVGEGPERRNIEQAAALAGIADQMILTGQVKDITPYYVIADALALPSLSEGSPNAMLEAMMAGVPVVATAVGGVPEIAGHEASALLVKPHDPVALAQALGRVLSEPQTAERLKAAARELAVVRHSPEARARALIEIYARLSGKRCGTVPSNR